MPGITATGFDPAWSPGGRPTAAALLATALPLALASCGGDGAPTDPDPGPSTGSIEVSTATSGPETDPDGAPAWSSDGARIAFETNRSGTDVNFEIHLVDADGQSETPLTTDPARDGSPAWSP